MGTYKLSYTGQEVNNILGTAKTLSAKVADLEGALDSLPSNPEGSPIAGIVYPFAGETVPEGFLICDGEAYSRDEYTELFEAIGTTYGEGDGSTTFNVPDLQTRVPVGAGVDYELGEVGGEAEHTLTVNEMPSHKHRWRGFEGSSGVSSGSYNVALFGSDYADALQDEGKGMQSAGGDQPHNNMQPYTVVNYIISTGKSADARPMTISETTVQSSAVAGMVYPFAGEGDPEGFLLCDGSEYSRTEYAKLFDAIGTTYGAGDGSTTFNLPNIESRTIIGESDSYALGATGGEEKHTLTDIEMPAHGHQAYVEYDAGSASAPAWMGYIKYGSWAQTGSSGKSDGLTTIDMSISRGGSQPHNNMQPYVVMRYFISTGEGGVVSGDHSSAVYGITPADYVVEWGQTDGWHWEKYASGKAECWAILIEENNEPYSTWNNMPFRYTPMWEFPIEFLDVPSVSYAGYIGSGYAIDARAEATKDWVRLFFATSSTGSQRVEAHIQAKGFWKDAPASGGTAVGHFDNATVENDLEVSGTLTVDGREYGVNKVLWSSSGSYMNADQAATLTEAVSAQPNGIVVVWSRYNKSSSSAYNDNFTYHFIPKAHVSLYADKGVTLGSINIDGHMMKYLYVGDTQIKGYNTNGTAGAGTIGGVAYDNGNWVMRYVLGV